MVREEARKKQKTTTKISKQISKNIPPLHIIGSAFLEKSCEIKRMMASYNTDLRKKNIYIYITVLYFKH